MTYSELSRQAQNNIKLCKGNPVGKIVLLWEIGMIDQGIIDELAEYYNVKNTKEEVALAISLS